jgi:PTH1 family peptidyl-tRNA hydrolase
MRSLFRSFMPHAASRERTPKSGPQTPSVTTLVAGLGNPGKEHGNNRHNVGFWCVNQLAREAGMDFARRTGLASVAEGSVAGRPVALAKPRTFVNGSGEAVRELLRRYGLQATDLIVVCDDLDMAVGSLRIRERGGHGGHNGLRSIIAAIGSENFARVRIGIGRPSVGGVPTWDPERIAAYVLGDPPASERRALDERVTDAVAAVRTMLGDGVGMAMGRFNTVREP